MAFRIPGIRKASLSASKGTNVPKGYLAVYVGDKMRRFVIPVCYLNQTSFQELLNQAEEEFGYDHPTGGLTIPCICTYLMCLTGIIAAKIGTLSKLVTLDLSYNNLHGKLPRSLSSLTQLIVLDVSFNSLSATIRSKLGEFKNLTFLSLASNRIEGPIQQQLGTLRDLQELHLSNRRSCCRE
ncbi:hypothetical protein HN51_034454 [Arachis hypogaea]